MSAGWAAVAAPVLLPLLWWAGWTTKNAIARAVLNFQAVMVAITAGWVAATEALPGGGAGRVWPGLVAGAVVFVAYPLAQRRVPQPRYG